jgi:uncharacterized membrane protein YgdD (TMEM256/DUF423 family)
VNYIIERAFPFFLLLCVLVLGAAEIMLAGPTKLQINSILLISASIGGLVAYIPVIYALEWNGWRNRNNIFAYSIVMGCVGNMGVQALVMMRRANWITEDSPYRYAHTPFLLLVTVATFLIIIAPRYSHGVVAPRRWLLIGCIVAATVAIVSITAYLGALD